MLRSGLFINEGERIYRYKALQDILNSEEDVSQLEPTHTSIHKNMLGITSTKEPVSYMFVFCRVKWPARSFNLWVQQNGKWAHATFWYILPRSNTSGSCGCTWTPFKEVLFSRTLCVSFLAVLIFFLIRTLDFHVWWRLSADCLCSSIFSVSKMKLQPTWHMEAEALKAFLLQTCLGLRIKARVSTCWSQTFRGCVYETHKSFVNQFVDLALGIAIGHL